MYISTSLTYNIHTTIVVTVRRRPKHAKLGTGESHSIDILIESLAWNKNILKDLLNKRNPVPFHPGSTVTNQGKQNNNIWGKLLASLFLSKAP